MPDRRTKILAARWIPVAVVVIPIAIALAWLGGGHRLFSQDTHLTSDGLSTPNERVEALKPYIPSTLPLRDATFEVIFQDHSDGLSLLPAPSDFDIRARVLVEPTALEAWTRGHERVKAAAMPTWASDLEPTDTAPITIEWYSSGATDIEDAQGTVVGVDREAAVVWYRHLKF